MDIDELLQPTDQIRFNPGLDYNGSIYFTFKAWDQTDSNPNTTIYGDTTSFSENTAQANIIVYPKWPNCRARGQQCDFPNNSDIWRGIIMECNKNQT